MKHLLPIILLFVTLAANAQNKQLTQLLDDIKKLEEKYRDDNPIWRGRHAEFFKIPSVDKWIERGKEEEALIKKLEQIPDSELTTQEIINRDIRLLELGDDVSEMKFKRYLVTMNAEGGYYSAPVFFLDNRLPFENVEDYEDYLKWLPSFGNYVLLEKDLLSQGIKEKIMAPKVVVLNNLKLIEGWTIDVASQPFFRPLLNMPDGIGEADRKRLTAKATDIINESILPAYRGLQKFLKEKYLKSAPDAVGVGVTRIGKAFYENRIRHFTTLPMTPDSVFNLGLSEVDRIKGLMNKVIQDLKFKGSFADFIHFLRTDPQFYAKTPQELLERAAWLSKKAEGQLPRLFSRLYALPFTVAPVPADIAPTYTGGRYVQGNRERNTPGTYWVNTYDLPSRPFYTLPALTVHEAVPGHHLQIILAAELKDVPDFRKRYYISAFGEGWGLYSEFLGEEMGMYDTPYELFGRYTYEMWRACRLVVDVGMHYKGWTREKAVDFLAGNTALSMHEVNTEIDRYIGWPGQAVSYKVGELTIKQLRKYAEEKLGDKFDIQQFHEVVLKDGSIPLYLVRSNVENWVGQLDN